MKGLDILWFLGGRVSFEVLRANTGYIGRAGRDLSPGFEKRGGNATIQTAEHFRAEPLSSLKSKSCGINVTMTLKDRISEDMKQAMRAKDSARLSAIRLLLAAVKQREVDERIMLDDAQVVSVVDKMIKQRRESISQYEKAGRQDLVDAEAFELQVLQAYLPQQCSEAEVEAIVAAGIAEAGAKAMADMGKVMNLVRPKLAGRADMAKVSALVKAKLAG
jgi:uncharacterized protein YqeY